MALAHKAPFSSLRFGRLNKTFWPLMQPEVSESESLLKLGAWALANQKRLITALCGAAVLAFIGYAYWSYEEAKEVSASEALSNIQPTRNKENPVPGEMAQAYLKVAQEHVGTTAAKHATLRAATALFNDGKYAEAQAQFEKFLSLDPGSSFAPQAAFGIAASLDAAGKLNEAQAKYDEVTKRYASDGVAEDAKLALANLYVAQNKPEMAYKMFDEITQATTRGGASAQEAAARREELAQQFPYLRSNTPAVKPLTAPAATMTNIVKRAVSTASNAVQQATNRIQGTPAPTPKP